MIICYDCWEKYFWINDGRNPVDYLECYSQGKYDKDGNENKENDPCHFCGKRYGIFTKVDIPSTVSYDFKIPLHISDGSKIIGEYFLIRHKATGKYMPQAKKNRGYTHWNPSGTEPFDSALSFPRLIETRKKAQGCINQWTSMPNGKQSYSVSYYGTETEGVDITQDGRKKDDLEIVEVQLVIK